MVAEGMQNYVDMAAGLTKATRAKATAAAKNLLASAGLEDVAADARTGSASSPKKSWRPAGPTGS